MKNTIASLSLVLTMAPFAGAQQLKPWPGDNPPGTQAVPAPVVNSGIQTPNVGTRSSGSQGSGGGGSGGAQILQQLSQALAGGGEAVSGGEGSDTSGGGSGYSNSVDNALSYKNGGDSSCIKIGGTPCTPQRLVDGCPNTPGKLKFSNSSDGKIGSGCEDIQMSEALSDALDMNFARCAKQAAGISSGLENPKIYHMGAVSSDKNHKHTGSMHEDGRALDIRAIELGGTVYDAQNNAHDPFFEKFRKCWGDAVNGLNGNCLTNTHPGSVGDEDSRHRDHHLHISMPLCPQEARAQGRKIAWFELLFGELAFAQDKSGYLPSTPTFKGKTIKLKDGGVARLVVEDTGGEPIGADTRISLDVKCAGEKTFTKLEKPVEGCRYDSSEYDAATNIVTIRYSTSVMNKGLSECSKQETKILKVTCPRAKVK